MDQTSIPNDPDPQHTPSLLWRVVRLVPLSLMLFTLSVLLVMFLMGGMTRITSWYLLQFVPPLLGVLSLIVLAIYAIVRRKFDRLMGFTALVAILCILPAITLINPVAFPASLENSQPAATVRLPSNEKLQVAWGGDEIKTNYHAVAPDQRWAYDLVVDPYFTASPILEDYGCYGTPVVAPANGVVVQAHDGEPDEIPGMVSNNFTAPTGNHVSIQLGTETFLVIAHLKPGSVVVAIGETVEEGQVIGECGNSGNTSEPHIHIHHQRQDPNDFPLNFAEGLPLYFRDHDGEPMPVGGFKIVGESVFPTGDTVQHTGE